MKHYLYRHIRLDKYEPFYIGIGTKRKNYNNSKSGLSRSSNKNRNNIWHKIVKKTNYKVEILLESNDYKFIKNKEIEFIKLYGKIKDNTGTLSNITDGGDGIIGYKHTNKTKELLKLKNLGKKLSEETKKKIGLSGIGRKIVFTKEHNEKISKSRLSKDFVFPDKCKIGWFKKGISSIKSKEVLNLETGIFYDSIAKVAESANLKVRSLNRKVNNKRKNNTNFIKL